MPAPDARGRRLPVPAVVGQTSLRSNRGHQAGYPGSEMIPALSALLALLTLKLLDKERRSHINDFNFDEALGLFAGLNILPKKVVRHRLLVPDDRARINAPCSRRGSHALGTVMFPEANTFSLDFPPIPYRGDPTGLDRTTSHAAAWPAPASRPSLPSSKRAAVLCYANANLTRADQPGELMQFVEFWHAITGSDPQWLYFDSKLVDYPELSRVNQRGIHFITIRRRGTAILRRLQKLPRSSWTGAVLDTPQALSSADPVRG